VANLLRDRKLLELARQEAQRFVKAGEKEMPREAVTSVWAHLKAHWQRHYGLVEAG
jgi:ATP-dependent DNA helicase RecG